MQPSDDSRHAIIEGGFALHNTWELLAPDGRTAKGHPRLHVVLDESGPFPFINGSFRIRRLPLFHLANVSLPMACFSGLSFVQFALPAEDTAGRLGIALTLLLTAAAYKYVAASLTPPVSYLTALDLHATLNALFIVVLTLGGLAAGLLADEQGGPPDDGREALRTQATVDRCIFATLFAGWICLQARSLMWLRSRRGIRHDEAARLVAAPAAKNGSIMH